jgi:acetyl esterase/lipase
MRKALQKRWAEIAVSDAARKAVQTPPTGVEAENGLSYASDGHPQHQLNLYRPAGAAGPLPAVVDIHGGGWMYGDKELNRHYCMYLASRGYAVMGMGYRLLPETDLRGQVQDIFASLRWLEAHGPARGFDLSRVLLTGDSAGGHLTGLVACVQASPELQAVYGVAPLGLSFSAMAICHGVSDLDRLGFAPGRLGRSVDREMARMLFGPRPERAPWYGRAAFAATAAGLDLPPVLVVGGDGDFIVHQTRSLVKGLEAAGRPHELLYWPEERGTHLVHVFNVSNWEWRESRETNDRMLAFFDRCAAARSAARA